MDMNTKIYNERSLTKFSACRRQAKRQLLQTNETVNWSRRGRSGDTVAIELDARGGRLVLPWAAKRDEVFTIERADDETGPGTRIARVAWTERLGFTNHAIVGVEFLEESVSAA